MTRIIHSLEATAECKILCLGETGAVVKLDDNNSGKLLSGACNTDSESSRKAASAALSSAMRNPANFGLLVRCVERCAGGQKHGVPYLLRAVESAIKSCDQENRAKLPIEELLPVLCRIEYDVNYVEAVGSCIGEITAVSPTTFYTYLISCADWDKQDTGRLSLITGMRYALPHSPEITDSLLKAVNKCFSRYTSKDSIEERYALTRLLFVILDCAPGVLHRAEPTLTTGLLNELKEHKELITRMAKLDYKEDHGLPCRRAAYDCARRLITHKDTTLTPLFKGGEGHTRGF
ncbi:hypothetical protein ADEAN_000283000 [Angomonas deanei]|uniref:Uncharacterized protein n=1 Tax=Angomonas deanei TaxID=59799 RepID=A0A7G2C7E5_9TRYP|nr:hypothetical protein ADEAN_000283000 [Angomonas deanei]